MKDNSTYNVGIYIRLSREDDDSTNESESITNQRDFLEDYVRSNRFNLIDEYVDDGFTGTNFERPAFKRMISDIESCRINCVITKDMSRLGRDYIGIGNYIEKYFPEHNIRYIAVNDGLDTINGGMDDITPFKAIINDYYAKDISKKVRTAITTMKKQGKFLGGIPPYGYKFKSDDNHYELVIDEETANVLKTHYDGKVWLHTGDLGYMTKDGVIHYQSRLKRMIISNGYNIYPMELEEVINKCEYVETSVVVAMKHKDKGEVPKAVIVLKENVKQTKEVERAIKKYCQENLSRYKIPQKYEFRETLPKTKIGKVDYKKLEQDTK